MFRQCLLFIILNLCLAVGLTAQEYFQESELANGNWFRVSVTEAGLYKMDRDFLESLGINTSTVDPRNIQVFGQGGRMLPQLNSDPRPNGLIQNQIFVSGEEDGQFDNNDYVLFYAVGPDSFEYDESGNLIYTNNFYSEESSYFVTVANDPGLRVNFTESEGTSFPRITSFNDFDIHELDLTNIIASGRQWFGERFDQSVLSRDFSFNFPGLINESAIRIESSVMGQAFDNTSFFTLSLNGNEVGDQNIGAIDNPAVRPFRPVGATSLERFEVFQTQSSEELVLTVDYSLALSSISVGFLDYLTVSVDRQLALYDNITIFRSLESQNNVQSTFEVGNASPDTRIWDVTSPTSAEEINFDLVNGSAVFGRSTSQLREFVVFEGSDFPSPQLRGQVLNQNLRGNSNIPNLLIVTNELFRDEANRFAVHRSAHSGITVNVVSCQEIFNEFSSGTQDATAVRDYVRFLFSAPNSELENVLFFGKTSYDPRDIENEQSNLVVTYISRNTLDPLATYTSDDYFVFLEDDEGEWPEAFNDNSHTMELGTGRIPASTREEARNFVDKIIRYDTDPAARGEWRHKILFSADDEDDNLHIEQADSLSNIIERESGVFNQDKIYVDAFLQIETPGGEVAEDVTEALSEAINEGRLIVNYSGHGNERILTSEEVIDIPFVQQLDNRNRLPLFVTATCEFGRHDDTDFKSGGEILVLNPNGGGIGLITASRSVFSSSNFNLNEAFYEALVLQNQLEVSLGEVFRQTKNASINGVRNRNYIFLGDPSMTLAFPENEATITNTSDTLRAQGRFSLEGEIRRNNQLLSDFNGTAEVLVFDKARQFQTLGNDVPQFTSQIIDEVLFRGEVSVVNGLFNSEFVLPSNIDFRFDEGRVSIYAIDDTDGREASGFSNTIIVGGSDNSAVEDNQPPEISLFINDTTFENGDNVGFENILLARLADENGINISTRGIGNNITVSVDGGEEIVINDFYTASLNTFELGWVEFPLSGLEQGLHTVTLRAADTRNNFNEETIEFIVGEEQEILVTDIFNFPNPFSSGQTTNFSFRHSRPGDDLEITLEIYSLQGSLVDSFQTQINNSESVINELTWDGVSSFGKNISTGIYIFSLNVRSLRDNLTGSAFSRLVILN